MKHLIFYSLILLAPLTSHSQQPGAAPATQNIEKTWYEYVFFSPLVTGVVVTGCIGWILLCKGEELKGHNTVTLEQTKQYLETLNEYKEQCTEQLQAPGLEAYIRLDRFCQDAPNINDNNQLIDHLIHVLEPYSRFRVAYTEAFRVSTLRFCPAVADAFSYISKDFCDVLIHLSANPATRRSDERHATIKEAVERLKHNLDCIEKSVAALTIPNAKAA